MRFSDWLKGYKLDNNLNIPKMSKMTGIPMTTIDHHLYYNRLPQPKTFAKYAVFFGIDKPEYLQEMYSYFRAEERAYKTGKGAKEQ